MRTQNRYDNNVVPLPPRFRRRPKNLFTSGAFWGSLLFVAIQVAHELKKVVPDNYINWLDVVLSGMTAIMIVLDRYEDDAVYTPSGFPGRNLEEVQDTTGDP